jgi:2-polyprenyl-3-methyl-5-hydroxy-6-metoxy-1,4-benzoquinol methylase
MADNRQYVMSEIDGRTESGRLDLLELSRDPETIGRLAALDIQPGWRCLEVGAGHGSIARWLADQVGSTGSVVAADIDPRFLTEMPENVEVRRLDIRQEDAEAGVYDLVHCRALLMHLPDPARALARLAAALRPGGVILAEEPDYGLYTYGGHPDVDALNVMTRRALDAVTQAGIFNAWLGRGLPAMLPSAGLVLRGTAIETKVSQPGDPRSEFERLTALESVPPLVAAGVVEETSLAQLKAYFGQPGTIITGSSLVAAWAQKPA